MVLKMEKRKDIVRCMLLSVFLKQVQSQKFKHIYEIVFTLTMYLRFFFSYLSLFIQSQL